MVTLGRPAFPANIGDLETDGEEMKKKRIEELSNEMAECRWCGEKPHKHAGECALPPRQLLRKRGDAKTAERTMIGKRKGGEMG